ncbi:MAG: amidohydrolase [Clostridiales bacterium]|nr:amidohydrolase [Clostridiales bacterium]MCF8023336.1 amidohydrolase [Clostridiales bacterium]
MLAIVNAKIYTITQGEYYHAAVLVDEGKIVDVGPDIQVPGEAEVINAGGKTVLPGFIDAHCHLGIMEDIFPIEGDDGNENTDPVTPQLRAIDAVNPDDIAFKDAVAGGVTTAVVSPGSANVIGGEMTVIKTCGKVIDDMVLRPAGIKAALGENPKRVYGTDKKMPATRMASAALLREALVEAQDYITGSTQQGEKKDAKRNLKMESLARVLRGELPLRVHAHRADDIMTAVRIAREFNLSLILEHCTEGHRIAEYIARESIPVVTGPVITSRAKVELKEQCLENAAVLDRAGVPLAIMTDHPVVPAQYLSLSAGLACRAGLSEERALEAITIQAARIAGVEDRLGSLEQGKDADIVIMDGDPFNLRSRIVQVFIKGKKCL